MSSIQINPAARSEIESLHLDEHFHPYGLQFGGLFGKLESTCNKGPVHTYEACRVVSHYYYADLFDVSHKIFRIWNAFKSLFGYSEWQQGIKQCAKVLKGTDREKSVKEIEKVFSKAYEAAVEGALSATFKKPEGPCRLVLN